MTLSQMLLLGLPSIVLWGVILGYRQSLQGWRVVWVFVAGIAVYSVVRASAIGAVMGSIAGERPYLMRHPLLPLGASSPQEIVGWGVAVGLAWALAERAAAVLGCRAGPARVSIAAFVAMTTISAAVEGAAIAGGWWQWTLPSGEAPGIGWSVPSIALIDWGFVALDFLLPLLVWLSGRPAWQLLLALTVFPLHFLSHTMVAALIPGLPLTGFDVGHVCVLMAIVAMTLGERGASRDPVLRESRWWLAPMLALALALWTGTVASLHQKSPITSLPLALLALVLFASEIYRTPVTPAAPHPLLEWTRSTRRVAAFVFGSAAMLAWLWPGAAHDRALQNEVDAAAAAVGRGDLTSARFALARAQAIEPQHASVATLLGLVALRDSQDAEARGELDRALRLSPNSRTALQLATIVALRQREISRAVTLAARARGLYPDDGVFRYLEAASAATGDPANRIAMAESAPPAALAELASVAQLIGDQAMLLACQQAMRKLPSKQDMKPIEAN
ncbi:MAG: hypothetical protein ABI411_03645 [Tahibacter sp.]